MIETLLALMMVLAVPLILLVVLLKVALTLLFLPFKILGFALKLVFGIVGAVVGVVFSGIGLGVAALIFVAVVIALPLLPIALVGLAIWLVARASRPRTAIRVA